jgi:hypothetical protein
MIYFYLHFTSIILFRHSRYKITEYLVHIDPVLQYPVAFGITFDKVTLLKRSIQTTLLITFVDGVLTPIYLQSPLCKVEISGKELAEK